ncbi:seipin-3-like [Wolffia australiana]
MESETEAEDAFFDACDTPPLANSAQPSPLLPLRRLPFWEQSSPSPLPFPNRVDSPPSPDLLRALINIFLKIVAFQTTLLLSSIAFPLRLISLFSSFLSDPRGTLHRWADQLWRISSSFVENHAGLALRVSVGCFWALVVLCSLMACLVFALFVGKIVMAVAVEEPLDFAMDLSFDFTRSSPMAEVSFPRPLSPPGRRFRSTVSLTLAESEYNRNLGIFQVRVEFLTADQKPLASSSRPCMMRFKSAPVRILETILKLVLVLVDISSETQTISLSMGGFAVPASAPAASAMVVLEPRAGQRLGTGLPELYSASLRMESELPLMRRLLWSWRRTLFVSIAIFIFNFELLLLLICCTPLLLPGYYRRAHG